MKKILSILSLSLFMLFTLGSVDEGGSKYPPKTEDGKLDMSQILTTKASEIKRRYRENEIAAKSEFKNKWYIISGTIRGFDSTFGMLSLDLSSNDGMDIHCLFPKDSAPVLSKLKKGDFVTICGKIDFTLGDIDLDNCIILKKPETAR
ncbi:MAG: hypothetical protein R3Y46_07300 [Opitutales bacterium]